MAEKLPKKVTRVMEAPYRGIQTELTRRVRHGLWAKGSMIPSRRALADEFRVSVPTVQKAISDMVADGILRVDANRTFVFGDPDHVPAVSEPETDLPFSPVRTAKVGNVALLAAVRVGDAGQIANAWPVVMIDEAEHALSRAGLQTVFINRYSAELRLHNTSRLLTEAQKRQVDEAILAEVLRKRPSAVIAFTDSVAYDLHRFVRKLNDAGILVVIVFSTVTEGLGCPVILCDNVDAGSQATNHLLQRGGKNLLYFSPFKSPWGSERLIGFRLACSISDQLAVPPQEYVGDDEIADLQAVQDFVKHSDMAYEHASQLLATGIKFDGVVAANDHIAAGFAIAAAEQGKRPGRDYLLIGFDDKAQSRELGLSSMHPPVAGMGREAALAISRLLQGQDEISAIVLKSRLVARSSTSFDYDEQTDTSERISWNEE
ncbi:MAG TPA: substrate-binding domain-containing protein [Capsulimonadaceae bacterium]|jgi:DNA-binding LacI/PurR family transcriptional regulator